MRPHTLKEYNGNKPKFYSLGLTLRKWEINSGKHGFTTIIKTFSNSIITEYEELTKICDNNKSASVSVIIKLNSVIRKYLNYMINYMP